MRFVSKCGATSITEPNENLLSELPWTVSQDYSSFLTNWNGVVFEPVAACSYQEFESRHEFYGRDWIEKVDQFDMGVCNISLLYSYDPKNDLSLHKSQHAIERWIPDRFLAIGALSNPYDRICLSTSGTDNGAVFLWSYPHEDLPSSPTTTDLYFIAPSFSAFWSMITGLTTEKYVDLSGD